MTMRLQRIRFFRMKYQWANTKGQDFLRSPGTSRQLHIYIGLK